MDVELETSTHKVAAAERGPLTSTHVLFNMICDAKRHGDKKLVKRLIAAYDEAAVREAVTVSATTSVDEGGRVKLVLCPVAGEPELYDNSWLMWGFETLAKAGAQAMHVI